MSRADVLLISKKVTVNKRTTAVAKSFSYELEIFETLDQFLANESAVAAVPVIVVYAGDLANEGEVVGVVQVVRQTAMESKIIVIVDGKMTPEATVFVKKSGANTVLLENEFHDSSKFEFVVSQILRASLVPIKAADLLVGSHVDFNIYHLMTLNKKYLMVHPNGAELSQAKYEKIEQIGDVFIKREDIPAFEKYVKEYESKLQHGLKARCRAQFLSLTKYYTDLILHITDQSEFASFDEGKNLAANCQQLANDLVSSLGSVTDAWDIVTSSAEGEFGSVERAPAIAAYAGLIGFNLNLPAIGDMMVAALLCDIGLLDLDPRITQKIRIEGSKHLHPEDAALYQHHPVISLNRTLSRKLPISDLCKTIITTTHERADQKGFPNRVRSEKVPIEAFIIQLSERLDALGKIKMGEKRKSPAEIRRELFQQCLADAGWFPPSFMALIKPVLLTDAKASPSPEQNK